MGRYSMLFVLAVSSAVSIFADTGISLSDVQLVRVYQGDTIFVNIPDLHPIIGKLLIDAGPAVHYNGKGSRHNWCG